MDLLAIAAFYQNVIVPIESSGSFISLLYRAGATHLRVAKDKLDSEFANRSRAAVQRCRQVAGLCKKHFMRTPRFDRPNVSPVLWQSKIKVPFEFTLGLQPVF